MTEYAGLSNVNVINRLTFLLDFHAALRLAMTERVSGVKMRFYCAKILLRGGQRLKLARFLAAK
jgi:hypothetical protein